jgi:hypothetical protein
MEKPFRKTGKVMNVPLLKRFCEGGVFGWWETVAERIIPFSQPCPQVPQVLPRFSVLYKSINFGRNGIFAV